MNKKAQFVVGEVLLGIALIIGATIGTYVVIKDIVDISYVGDKNLKIAYDKNDVNCEAKINSIIKENLVAFNTIIQVKTSQYNLEKC